MGITRVANITGLDRIGVPVIAVYRPNSRSLVVAQGKGFDLESAAASGLMESTELYHAEHIQLPLKLGSLADLGQSHSIADIGRLPKVNGSSFHDDLETLWVEGIDLMSNVRKWVPYECVRANFTLPLPPGSGCFDCSSNGLASGNTISEAICHAICEIVERDATALWNSVSMEARSKTKIDLQSIKDKTCKDVLERLLRAQFSVDIWELTTDIGVPTFFCLIEDLVDEFGHCGIGAGTHPAAHIALLRALTEAIQVRTTYIAGARDDLLHEEFEETQRASQRRIAERMRAARAPKRDFSSIDDYSSASFADDLAWLLSHLKRVGIQEVIAVDLTRSEIGIPVVRVVIPGLEGPDDHDNYVPGLRARQMMGCRP